MEYQNYNKESIKKQSNSKLFIIVICLCLFILMVIGVSIATFTYTKENNDGINTISTGNIYLNYNENTNGINITNAYPMTDDVGKLLTDENQYFDFSINATLDGDVVANYEISAEKEVTSTLANDDVKLYLEREFDDSYEEVMEPKHFTPLEKSTDLGTPAGTMLLYSDSVSKTSVINYRLRMWVDADAVLDGLEKSFAVRVSIKAKVDLAE